MKPQKLSLLEQYVEILRSLEKLESANLSDIERKTNIGQTSLKRAISFLEEQNLITSENTENETVYKTTPRGDRVTRYFREQPQETTEEELNFT